MLSKLALRNAHRSIKDYFIYISTISMAVALMFSMSSLSFTDNIKLLSTMITALDSAMVFVTIIIMVIISWLIYYIIKFILEKRSKEFGTYLLLGINTKKIALLFTLENFAIGILSFVIGILLGSFLYQLILVLIYGLFDQPYQIQFIINWQAVLVTLVCYGLVYLISFIRSYLYLRKVKVIDLIHAEKKNEQNFLKSKRYPILIFLFSIIFIAGGLLIFHYTMEPNSVPSPIGLLVSVSLILLGLYGSYMSFSSFVTTIISNTKKPLKKMNTFLFRTLTSKINTMSFTLGTLSVLLTFTFIFSSFAIMINSYYMNQAESFAPFDIIAMQPGENNDFELYEEFLAEETIQINGQHQYYLYTDGSSEVSDKLNNIVYDNMPDSYDLYISLSDYNHLRQLLDEAPVTLDANQFLIQTRSDAGKTVKETFTNSPQLLINGQTLTYKETQTIHFSQNGMNGNRFLIVIPDELTNGMHITQSNLAIDIEEETTEQLAVDLRDVIDSRNIGVEQGDYSYFIIRGAEFAQNKSIYATFAFSLIYLSIAFFLVAITILAIQQLSDSAKYRSQYKMLSKLGANAYQIKSLILKQLAIYFGAPTILPLIISTVIILSLNRWFYVHLESISTIFLYILGGYSVFFFIYLIYFIITYLGFVRNIESK